MSANTIFVSQIEDRLMLRENQEKIGHLKPTLKGFELKYQDSCEKINVKKHSERLIIEIKNQSYQIIGNKIRTEVDKRDLYFFETLHEFKYLKNHQKVRIVKIFSINGISYLQFLKEPSNLLVELFFSLLLLNHSL